MFMMLTDWNYPLARFLVSWCFPQPILANFHIENMFSNRIPYIQYMHFVTIMIIDRAFCECLNVVSVQKYNCTFQCEMCK